MSEIEEIIARAIAEWSRKSGLFTKAGPAILATIDAAGYVVVPKEPTDAMIAAGVTAFMNDAGVLVADRDALFVWRAMIAASRIQTEQEG